MIRSKVFRHKRTGELATVIPLYDINDWEEVKNPSEKQYRQAERNNPMHSKAKLRGMM